MLFSHSLGMAKLQFFATFFVLAAVLYVYLAPMTCAELTQAVPDGSDSGELNLCLMKKGTNKFTFAYQKGNVYTLFPRWGGSKQH